MFSLSTVTSLIIVVVLATALTVLPRRARGARAFSARSRNYVAVRSIQLYDGIAKFAVFLLFSCAGRSGDWTGSTHGAYPACA